MEELEKTTVGDLKRHMNVYGCSYRVSCTKEIKEQLETLSDDTFIITYGEESFRLADPYPSYYVKQLKITKKYWG